MDQHVRHTTADCCDDFLPALRLRQVDSDRLGRSASTTDLAGDRSIALHVDVSQKNVRAFACESNGNAAPNVGG